MELTGIFGFKSSVLKELKYGGLPCEVKTVAKIVFTNGRCKEEIIMNTQNGMTSILPIMIQLIML